MEQIKPMKCTCGAAARVRFKDPYVWVECKNKCGKKSGFYFIFLSTEKEKAENEAVKEWNEKIEKVKGIF